MTFPTRVLITLDTYKVTMKRYLYIILIVSLSVKAQDNSYSTVNGDFQDQSLSRIFETINQSSQRKVHFKPEWFNQFTFSGSFTNDSIEAVLRKLLYKKGFAFIEYQDDFYIIKSSSLSKDMAELVGINRSDRELSNRTQNPSLVDSFDEVDSYLFSGTVLDANSQEPVLSALVNVDDGTYSTVSNNSGYFELTIPTGTHKITFSQVAYEPSTIELHFDKSISQDIQMFTKSQTLDEVVVTANNLQNSINNVESGVTVLNIESIKNLPTFLGEVDIIKTISALPGVTSVGEGASGFNVRGGNVDENLILLDGMPIFNSSHLFGFFSIFNSDVVDDFSLYKGGIPSRYGGRISSILDVKTAKGSFSNLEFAGTAGLVSSKLKLSGPLVKDKTAFHIGARSGYPTYLLGNFPNTQVQNSRAGFVDLNSRITHQFSDKSTLSVSNYYSDDSFRFGIDTTYNWDNFGTSVHWEKTISSSNFIGLRGVISNYSNGIVGNEFEREFDFESSIRYQSLEGNYIHTYSGSNLIEVGFQVNSYNLDNGQIRPTTSDSKINALSTEADKAIESAAYISFEKKLDPKVDIQAGLRVSLFGNSGPRTVYSYENPSLPSTLEVIDTVQSDGIYGEVLGYEPRFNLLYRIDPTSSFKLGYNLTRQNIHVISITSAIAPGDYWKLSDPNIPTTIANQFNIGYSKLLGQYGFSIDSYFKSIESLIDYRDGAQIFLNPQIETALVRSKGRSYGLELKIEKEGRLNGWVSYTFSRSERKSLDIEGIDTWFPTTYDKPHNLNVTSSYNISKRVALSMNFVFASGRAITIPETGYFFNNNLFVNYSIRNSGRIPNYNRLDLSFTIDGNLRKRGFKSRWAFSIYNLFGRRNPFSVYFDTVAGDLIPQGYRLSILGQAFPSISYSVKIN